MAAKSVTYEQVTHWQNLSPEDRLASMHYWRAKRANDSKPNGYWTGRQWLRLCERMEWRCYWCGEATYDLQPDHVIPIARGGTNALSNIVPACHLCNTCEELSSLKNGSHHAVYHPSASRWIEGTESVSVRIPTGHYGRSLLRRDDQVSVGREQGTHRLSDIQSACLDGWYLARLPYLNGMRRHGDGCP